MSITTFDGYIAAAKQKLTWFKQGTRTTIANNWFSLFDVAGNPGAGTLAGTSTTVGVVPTDATAGVPMINAFSGSNKGYISLINFCNTVACRLAIFDLLFKAGAYSYNSNVSLSTQPSYSSRVPGGTDYNGLQIWIEFVTASTGTQLVAVTYTDQSGNAGHTTGTVTTVVGTVGRMYQLPLAAGDSGVQKIESVVGSNASAGTFNVLVLRQLWQGRLRAANESYNHGMDMNGLPEVFADSALFVAINADGTSSGIPELQIDIANG